MGWTAEDVSIKEEAKVAVGLSRREVYKLGNLLSKIKHVEKGPKLYRLCDELYSKLDEIHAELNR